VNSLTGACRRLTISHGRPSRPQARLAGAALVAAIGAVIVAAHPARTFAQSDTTASAANVSAGAEDRPAQLIVDTNPKARIETYRFKNAAPGAPISLPPGEHRVHVSLPGYTPRTEHVRLDAGETRTLFAPIEAKSQRGAITRAVLFPGWGAYYMEKPRTAQALLLITGLAVGGAIYYDQEMQERVDDYEEALDVYQSAISPADAEMAWRAVEEADSDIDQAETIRNALVISAVVVHATGVAQAIFKYPWHDSEAQVSLSPRLDGFSGGAVRVSLVSLTTR
jgi:hypothetical protein